MRRRLGWLVRVRTCPRFFFFFLRFLSWYRTILFTTGSVPTACSLLPQYQKTARTEQGRSGADGEQERPEERASAWRLIRVTALYQGRVKCEDGAAADGRGRSMLQRARGFRGDGAGDADAETMRGKRQRQAAARASGEAAAAADEHLLHMDPSLMTERQQLAFLLRTTAQEASASESPHSEDDASGDDRRRARKKARREPRTREGGRGRPPRNATGPRPVRAPPAHAKTTASRTSPRTARHKPAFDGFPAPAVDGGDRRRPKAAAASPHDERENNAGAGNVKKEAEEDAAVAAGGHDLRSGKKPHPQQQKSASPSSSSDVVLLKASPFGGADDAFGAARTCALCGGAPFSDALFLCPACDLKYPTQQALGRMCMT